MKRGYNPISWFSNLDSKAAKESQPEQDTGMRRLVVMTSALSYDIITPAGVLEHEPKY
jgi:hypothetical protein